MTTPGINPMVEGQISRLAWDSFTLSSDGGVSLTLPQASKGLEHAFKQLQPVVPLPEKPWYDAVFRNYDLDKCQQVDFKAFLDIIQQYHSYHYERYLKKHQPSNTRLFKSAKGIPHNSDTEDAKKVSEREKLKASEAPPEVNRCDEPLQLASHIVYPTHRGMSQIYRDYEFGHTAGKGSFGKVQVVINKRTQQKRAAKTIAIQAIEQWELIKSEIDLLKSLNHPNIMKLYETYTDGYTIYLIIELCDGGQLFDRMVHHYQKLRIPITEQQVCEWIRQILSACAYCHARGIVHRDIKPENILFVDKTDDSPLKVIDFGLSATMSRVRTTAREVKEKRSGVGGSFARLLPSFNGKHLIPWYVRRVKMQRAGTPHYMAPEMIRGSYDEKCDVFGVGIIMYQLLSGVHPFYIAGCDDEESVKHKILNDEPPMTKEPWTCISASAKQLLKMMLRKNPKRRISAEEAIKHVWFEQMSSRNMVSRLTPSVFEGLMNWQNHTRLKQAVLQLLAKQLSEAEISELRKKFNALDTKGDGTITVDDLKNSMKASGYCDLAEHELENIVQSIDPSRQGSIGYNEFVSALMLRRMTIEEDQLREIFKKFDVNNEGRITVDALAHVLKSSKYGALSRPELEKLFNEIDKNRQGYVDFYDFCDIMLS